MPPPAPGLHRPSGTSSGGSGDCGGRGAASVEPLRPRPAAPRLTSPHGPGGAGAPLPGPTAAAAAPPGLRPPRPAAAGPEVIGCTNETLRAGGPDRGRPAQPRGPFGGLCGSEQGACADAEGAPGQRQELALARTGGGATWGGEARLRAGAERQRWDQRFPLQG